jgi:RNA-directed DNA polymerase
VKRKKSDVGMAVGVWRQRDRKAWYVNQGDLLGQGTTAKKSRQAGVRARIVAMKSRNGLGVKDAQENGDVMVPPTEKEPATVPETAKQAGEVRARWAWTEPAVWTERMLTALENGVGGGQWFSLIDKVYAPANLRRAFERVKANGGTAGVDHQTVEMFEAHLEQNLEQITQSLKGGTYRPQPVKRVWIPKPGTKEQRPLGIPTVRDRVVQTALRHVVEPIFERDFAEHSYGFRPKRSAKDALRRVDSLLKAGHHWVVDADLKSYYDTIPHQRLLERVGKKVSDGRVMDLLEGMLRQGVMEGMREWQPEEGTPQGAVISPLLSNVYLNPLDQSAKDSGLEMVRYADDFVILCCSEAEARRALAVVENWTAKAGLTLHPQKTRIVDATQPGGFDFLGYHFEQGQRWPRRKSLGKLRDNLRQKTKRNNGYSLSVIILNVNRTLKGWFQYFQHSRPRTFDFVDGWVRMRLRSILRHRRGGRGRGRGIDHLRWPNAFFAAHGLYSLAVAYAQVRQSSSEVNH